LEKSTRLDIGYATHQCARFSIDPKESHAIAVKRIGRYLKGTRDQGLILDPKDYSFEVFADADHSGNWKFNESADDIATAKSRTGYIIKYAGCPVVWHSKLQTEIALSSTEAEYVCLSESLRDTIPMMQLIKEIQDRGFKVPTTTPAIHCRLFEDNSGALELARSPQTAIPHETHESEISSLPIFRPATLDHDSPHRYAGATCRRHDKAPRRRRFQAPSVYLDGLVASSPLFARVE
jgi:hypothetical protein